MAALGRTQTLSAMMYQCWQQLNVCVVDFCQSGAEDGCYVLSIYVTRGKKLRDEVECSYVREFVEVYLSFKAVLNIRNSSTLLSREPILVWSPHAGKRRLMQAPFLHFLNDQRGGGSHRRVASKTSSGIRDS
eukprot:scaffold24577_cov37-Prasinocladus_malaysianus.AAC.1